MVTLTFENDYLTANGLTWEDVEAQMDTQRGTDYLKSLAADMDSARTLDPYNRAELAKAINAAISAKG